MPTVRPGKTAQPVASPHDEHSADATTGTIGKDTIVKLRTMALGVAAAALSLTLTACDGGSGSGTDSASAGGKADGATISTKFGDVQVPSHPKRVVALGWGDAETALALGSQPVGASDWINFGGDGVGPWAKGKYKKKPTLIATQEPNYEKIGSLKPDLILDVKSSGDKARYDKLKSIAPTVGVPKDNGDNYLTSMDQQVTMIAKALGKEDKGKELLAGVDKKFKTAAKANPEFKGKTATVAAYDSNGWSAYVKGSERSRFMQKLGFKQNPAVEKLKASGFTASISNEQLKALNSDVLVVIPIYVAKKKVTEQKAFQQLDVVKKKHAIVLDSMGKDKDISNAFSLSSTMSTDYAIDKMLSRIKEAKK